MSVIDNQINVIPLSQPQLPLQSTGEFSNIINLSQSQEKKIDFYKRQIQNEIENQVQTQFLSKKKQRMGGQIQQQENCNITRLNQQKQANYMPEERLQTFSNDLIQPDSIKPKSNDKQKCVLSNSQLMNQSTKQVSSKQHSNINQNQTSKYIDILNEQIRNKSSQKKQSQQQQLQSQIGNNQSQNQIHNFFQNQNQNGISPSSVSKKTSSRSQTVTSNNQRKSEQNPNEINQQQCNVNNLSLSEQYRRALEQQTIFHRQYQSRDISISPSQMQKTISIVKPKMNMFANSRTTTTLQQQHSSMKSQQDRYIHPLQSQQQFQSQTGTNFSDFSIVDVSINRPQSYNNNQLVQIQQKNQQNNQKIEQINSKTNQDAIFTESALNEEIMKSEEQRSYIQQLRFALDQQITLSGVKNMLQSCKGQAHSFSASYSHSNENASKRLSTEPIDIFVEMVMMKQLFEEKDILIKNQTQQINTLNKQNAILSQSNITSTSQISELQKSIIQNKCSITELQNSYHQKCDQIIIFQEEQKEFKGELKALAGVLQEKIIECQEIKQKNEIFVNQAQLMEEKYFTQSKQYENMIMQIQQQKQEINDECKKMQDQQQRQESILKEERRNNKEQEQRIHVLLSQITEYETLINKHKDQSRDSQQTINELKHENTKLSEKQKQDGDLRANEIKKLYDSLQKEKQNVNLLVQELTYVKKQCDGLKNVQQNLQQQQLQSKTANFKKNSNMDNQQTSQQMENEEIVSISKMLFQKCLQYVNDETTQKLLQRLFDTKMHIQALECELKSQINEGTAEQNEIEQKLRVNQTEQKEILDSLQNCKASTFDYDSLNMANINIQDTKEQDYKNQTRSQSSKQTKTFINFNYQPLQNCKGLQNNKLIEKNQQQVHCRSITVDKSKEAVQSAEDLVLAKYNDIKHYNTKIKQQIKFS